MDTVIDNEAMSRFELALGEGDIAVTYYRHYGDVYHLRHTEVPQHRSGQGAGSALARGVFELIGQRGQRAKTICPFMSAYAARHPEALALLVG